MPFIITGRTDEHGGTPGREPVYVAGSPGDFRILTHPSTVDQWGGAIAFQTQLAAITAVAVMPGRYQIKEFGAVATGGRLRRTDIQRAPLSAINVDGDLTPRD